MSWMFAGHLLLGSAQVAIYLYRLIRPHRIGIYGPTLSGKTTLDQYLTVPGDIDPIPLDLRTSHAVKNGSYQMPHSTKKQVRWKGERVPISTLDVAGQKQYWNMWAEDLIERRPSVIFYVVDQRIMQNPNAYNDAVEGFKFITDLFVNEKMPSSFSRSQKKRARSYKPSVVCLVINKMDLWWNNDSQALWDMGLKRQHPMAMAFQNDMRRLRRAGIATNVEAMAAQYGLRVEESVINTIRMI